MKNILVPVDFSDDSHNAVDHAIQLAREFGTALTLMNSFTMPYTNSSVIISMTDILRQNAEEDLANYKERLKKEFDLSGLEIKTEAILGEVKDAVDTVVKREAVDLIVMGTKGASGMKAALFGSNTASVIRRVDTPLLAVPAEASFKKPERVVFATDYELKSSHRSLRFLATFVSHFNAELNILNVREDDEDLPQFSEAIETIREDLDLDEVRHSYNIIDSEDVEEGINDHIHEYGGDVLAMVTHNYNAIEKVFHRSLTKQVALHTSVPLLALHEEKGER